MTFPQGVTTRAITAQTPFNEDGSPLNAVLTVMSSRTLVWEATGTPMVPTQRARAVDGVLSVEVPITTQAGWLADGQPIAADEDNHTHTYTITLNYTDPVTGRADLAVIPAIVVPVGDGSPLTVESMTVWGGGSSGPIYVPDALSVIARAETVANQNEVTASALAGTAQTLEAAALDGSTNASAIADLQTEVATLATQTALGTLQSQVDGLEPVTLTLTAWQVVDLATYPGRGAVLIECWGAGGGGGPTSGNAAGSGGGGGAYCRALFSRERLAALGPLTVDPAPASAPGASGSASSVAVGSNTLLCAYGGGAGFAGGGGGGGGGGLVLISGQGGPGTATKGGDAYGGANVPGGAAGASGGYALGAPFGGSGGGPGLNSGQFPGSGGQAYEGGGGGGGAGVESIGTATGGISYHGGAGGGSGAPWTGDPVSGGAGGISVYGGAGGAGGASNNGSTLSDFIGGDGFPPGGGGGGAGCGGGSPNAGGIGAAGLVRLTIY